MAPDSERNEVVSQENEKLVAPQAAPREYKIVYRNLLIIVYWHLGALLGLYQCFTSAKWATIWFNSVLYMVAILGITAGAHRLWSHRSYKAKLPLQILLMLFNSLAGQGTVCHWARDHRLHHKYSDTDADPHNAARGFFYSHMGWLLVRKHPESIKRGKTIDMSDLYNNPVLQFQKKYYPVLVVVLSYILPTLAPIYFWKEALNNAYHVSLLRLVVEINITLLVNSAAHKYGNKPYDKNLLATQSITLSLATLGECFHNYHHVFPYDYKTSEFGNNNMNLTTNFINLFAWIGWAYDLKSADGGMVQRRKERSGDGTDLWGRRGSEDCGEKDDVVGKESVGYLLCRNDCFVDSPPVSQSTSKAYLTD